MTEAQNGTECQYLGCRNDATHVEPGLDPDHYVAVCDDHENPDARQRAEEQGASL